MTLAVSDVNKIYLITNKNNGLKYVGCTNQSIKSRWGLHLWESDNGVRRLTKPDLLEDIATYGSESFTIYWLCSTKSRSDAYSLEAEFIRLFDTFRYGYNKTLGGAGVVGRQRTLEENIEMGKTLKNIFSDSEIRKHRSELQRGERNSRNILTESQVKEIINIYNNEDISQTQLGKMFNVEQTTISGIIRKKIWKHLHEI